MNINQTNKLNPTVSETQNSKLNAAKYSLVISFIVLALKAIGFKLSGSNAIFSDALETLINILTAGTALWVISYVNKPADEDHPYGHGKVEFFSAAFEGGLIIFAAFTIILESLQSFRNGSPLFDLDLGILFIFIASIFNALMAIYLKKIGNKNNSETLLASSAHLMSDVYTTVGVIIGLLLVKMTGIKWIDSAISLLVAVHLIFEGYKIIRKSISGLTDELHAESLEDLSKSIQKNLVPGVINIHNLRSIRSGNFHHIDAHLIVPQFWDVALVHRVTHDFEAAVVKDYPFEGEFAFHLDPCAQNYCSKCSVEPCPIRKAPFVSRFLFDAEAMIKPVAAPDN